MIAFFMLNYYRYYRYCDCKCNMEVSTKNNVYKLYGSLCEARMDSIFALKKYVALWYISNNMFYYFAVFSVL